MIDATIIARRAEDSLDWCRRHRWFVLCSVLFLAVARHWLASDYSGRASGGSSIIPPGPAEAAKPELVHASEGKTRSKMTVSTKQDAVQSRGRVFESSTAQWLASLDSEKARNADPILRGIQTTALAAGEEFTSFDAPVVIPLDEPTGNVIYILFRLNYRDTGGHIAAKLIRVYPGGHFSDLGPTLTPDKWAPSMWHDYCALFVVADLEGRKRNGEAQPDPEADAVNGIHIFELNDRAKADVSASVAANVDDLRTITKVEVARIEQRHVFFFVVRVHFVSTDGSARRHILFAAKGADPGAQPKWESIGADLSGADDFKRFCDLFRGGLDSERRP